MTHPLDRPEPALAPIATTQHDRPARFEAWGRDIKARCYELWSTLGNRNAGRVEWLLGRETPEGVSIPAGVTIRAWAREEDWEGKANGDLTRTRGRTLRQLQITWLRALELSQEVQIDAMLGRFDDNPQAGAVRVKAAESVQRVVAQAGLLALVPPDDDEPDQTEGAVSLDARRRRAREKLLELNQEGS